MTADPYRYFRVESREIVGELGRGVLELEKNGHEPALLSLLLRLAHTLKGASRVVRQGEIADRAHRIEDALALHRADAAPATPQQINHMLQLLDEITSRIDALSEPTTESGARAQDPYRTVGADVRNLDALLDGVAEARAQLAKVRRGVHALPVAEQELTRGLEHLDRELNHVLEAAERMRLLPASLIFNTIERVVRDTGASLGRPVVFEAEGGEVTVDAETLSGMQDALVQAARNAVAHGIEPTPEARRAAGKSAEGRVRLAVARRGARVSFSCSDDGRGVDLDAALRRARQAGRVPNAGPALPADEILRLLLEGGISTSETITEVSGRGVGLDVARETSRRLGGIALLRTERGKGTTLEIDVPVSRSSVEALMVVAGGQTVALPLKAVHTTLRLAAGEVTHGAGADSIALDGAVVPFAPLARWVSSDSSSRPSTVVWSVVVLEDGGALVAFGVDRLLRTERAVVRPLPAYTPSHPAVSGICLDSEGHPRLVLDPAGLALEIRRTAASAPLDPMRRKPVLVIDDSLTTRMLEQSILESAGYEVDLANCAEEALVMAHERRYSLFLVDVEMPGMDGFTFIQRSRADAELCDVPAILVTSRNSPLDRSRGEAVGAQDYVVKGDFDQGRLLERIRELVA